MKGMIYKNILFIIYLFVKKNNYIHIRIYFIIYYLLLINQLIKLIHSIYVYVLFFFF